MAQNPHAQLFGDAETLQLLRKFAKSIHIDDTIEFLNATYQFQRRMKEEALLIWETYLTQDAALQISIPPARSKELEDKVKKSEITYNMFEQAFEHVFRSFANEHNETFLAWEKQEKQAVNKRSHSPKLLRKKPPSNDRLDFNNLLGHGLGGQQTSQAPKFQAQTKRDLYNMGRTQLKSSKDDSCVDYRPGEKRDTAEAPLIAYKPHVKQGLDGINKRMSDVSSITLSKDDKLAVQTSWKMFLADTLHFSALETHFWKTWVGLDPTAGKLADNLHMEEKMTWFVGFLHQLSTLTASQNSTQYQESLAALSVPVLCWAHSREQIGHFTNATISAIQHSFGSVVSSATTTAWRQLCNQACSEVFDLNATDALPVLESTIQMYKPKSGWITWITLLTNNTIWLYNQKTKMFKQEIKLSEKWEVERLTDPEVPVTQGTAPFVFTTCEKEIVFCLPTKEDLITWKKLVTLRIFNSQLCAQSGVTLKKRKPRPNLLEPEKVSDKIKKRRSSGISRFSQIQRGSDRSEREKDKSTNSSAEKMSRAGEASFSERSKGESTLSTYGSHLTYSDSTTMSMSTTGQREDDDALHSLANLASILEAPAINNHGIHLISADQELDKLGDELVGGYTGGNLVSFTAVAPKHVDDLFSTEDLMDASKIKQGQGTTPGQTPPTPATAAPVFFPVPHPKRPSREVFTVSPPPKYTPVSPRLERRARAPLHLNIGSQQQNQTKENPQATAHPAAPPPSYQQFQQQQSHVQSQLPKMSGEDTTVEDSAVSAGGSDSPKLPEAPHPKLVSVYLAAPDNQPDVSGNSDSDEEVPSKPIPQKMNLSILPPSEGDNSNFCFALPSPTDREKDERSRSTSPPPGGKAKTPRNKSSNPQTSPRTARFKETMDRETSASGGSSKDAKEGGSGKDKSSRESSREGWKKKRNSEKASKRIDKKESGGVLNTLFSS